MSAELENPLHVRVNLCRLFYQGRDFFYSSCVIKGAALSRRLERTLADELGGGRRRAGDEGALRKEDGSIS